MDERWRRVRSIFEQALAVDRGLRESWLAGACGDDADLLAEVRALLAADAGDDSFLDADAGEVPASDAGRTETLRTGAVESRRHQAVIGPYRLLDKLGEGGMGEVWLAEQRRPMRRRVALKIIKPGMDSKAVIARFEAERQALALMDHPCVAKVLDGGATLEGRPFFAMELVRGASIVEHCDRQRLGIRDRIALFIRVCEAVQHAHSKGVIHRDLKPSNILVELVDGASRPKVIDFGVAKALHHRLTDQTLYTALGQMIGTPAYMSPEQAGVEAQDIDTRSDIYSLGIILYELLIGARPFEDDTLRRAGLAGIYQVIREVEPPRPSTRIGSLLSSSGGSAEMQRIFEARRTDAASLAKILRSDLDWVVMTCLEKDRERRYDTANALAMELRRYLAELPVLAGPPSRVYRLKKFVRRNRGPVAAGFTIALLAISGVAGISWQAVRATRAQKVAAGERDEARAANARAEEVKAFLAAMLRNANPAATAGRQVTLRDMLGEAARQIDEEPIEDPIVEAELRLTIGDTLGFLGAYRDSLPHLERAVELHQRAETDPADVFFGQAVMKLGHNSMRAGRPEVGEAILRQHIARMDRTAPSKILGTLLSTWGMVLADSDRFDDAIQAFEDAKTVYEQIDDRRFSYTQCLVQLALAKQKKGDGASSIGLLEGAVKGYGTSDDRPDARYRLAYLIEALGRLREGEGDLAGAVREYERSLEIRGELYPDSDHPDMAKTRASLESLRARMQP